MYMYICVYIDIYNTLCIYMCVNSNGSNFDVNGSNAAPGAHIAGAS